MAVLQLFGFAAQEEKHRRSQSVTRGLARLRLGSHPASPPVPDFQHKMPPGALILLEIAYLLGSKIYCLTGRAVLYHYYD